MEDMQQLDEQSELQQPTQETMAEPTNDELLKGLMGYEPVTTQNEITDNDKLADDNTSEVVEDDEQEETNKSFYSQEELANWDYDTMGDIDTSRIPPEIMPIYKTLQKGYTKKSQKLAEEKKQFENDKKTLDEELQAFQEKQKQLQLEQEAKNNGLSADDMIEINNIARGYFEAKGEIYDPNNEDHKVIFESVKKHSIDRVVAERKAIKIRNEFNAECNKRYGDKVKEVDRKAEEILINYPYHKAISIKEAIAKGNINVALALYDEAYQQLTVPQEEQKKPTQQADSRQVVRRPPTNLQQGRNAPTQPQKKQYDPYDITGVI